MFAEAYGRVVRSDEVHSHASGPAGRVAGWRLRGGGLRAGCWREAASGPPGRGGGLVGAKGGLPGGLGRGGPRYQDFTGEECRLPPSKSTLLSLRILLGTPLSPPSPCPTSRLRSVRRGTVAETGGSPQRSGLNRRAEAPDSRLRARVQKKRQAADAE